MRIAMLILGVVAGLAAAAWFVLVLIVATTTGERSPGAGEPMVLALGIMSIAWLFGVAFTWGRPNWTRPCYFVAAFCGVSAATMAASGVAAQVVPFIFAVIAGALIIMSFWAASELDARTEQEHYQDTD